MHKFRRKRTVLKPTEEITIQPDDTTRFRVHLYKERGKGKLYNFIYQLETFHEGKWKTVIRYNNFHGFVHKDVFNKNNQRIRREFFGKISIREATTIADRDIKKNYKDYIEGFKRDEL